MDRKKLVFSLSIPDISPEKQDPEYRILDLESKLKEMTRNYQEEKATRKELETKYEIIEKMYTQHLSNLNQFLGSLELPSTHSLHKILEEEYIKKKELEKISYEFEVQKTISNAKKKKEDRVSFWKETTIETPRDENDSEENPSKKTVLTITSVNGDAFAEQESIPDEKDLLEEAFFSIEENESRELPKKRSWTELVEEQIVQNKNKLDSPRKESRRLSEVESDKVKMETELLSKRVGQSFLNQSVNLGTEILEKIIMGIELSIKSTVNFNDKTRKFKVNDILTQTKFDFIDYYPKTFKALRELSSMEDREFRKSISDSHMKVIITPGKSGALLFFTGDRKILLKSVSDTELAFLNSILPKYYQHCVDNKSTLICRILAMYTLKLPNYRLHFIAMENLFPTPPEETYDLKGSSFGREAKEEEKMKKFFKDNDFISRKTKLVMTREQKQKFFHKVMSDVEFLRSCEIMDYSLLLGISSVCKDEKFEDNPKTMFTHFRSADGKSKYYLGIIDILQQWNLKKKAEMGLKSVIHEKKKISSVPPGEYSKRFLDFIFCHLVTEK